MADAAEAYENSPEGQKGSRRHRFRAALQKTKSKLKGQDDQDEKGEKGFKLSEDVNDFLHAGRSTSTSNPDDTLPSHPSPRRISLPRIDVSGSSQRWPIQRPVGGGVDAAMSDAGGDLLRPTSHVRSQSQGYTGAPRKKNRSRNLSVSFIDAPPVVIGEGGDGAETPPVEISRPRARSVSPMPYRGAGGEFIPHPSRAGTQMPAPLPMHLRGLRRETGFETVAQSALERIEHAHSPPPRPEVGSAFDRELEMSTLQSRSRPTPRRDPNTEGKRLALQPNQPSSVPRSVPALPISNPSMHPNTKAATDPKDIRVPSEETEARRQSRHQTMPRLHFMAPPPRPPPRRQNGGPELTRLALADGSAGGNNNNPNPNDVFSPTRPDSGKEEKTPRDWK